jgi:hypothetical protein
LPATLYATLMTPASIWTCPQPADTSDVGVSLRGGCLDGEEAGANEGKSTTTAIVHTSVQG